MKLLNDIIPGMDKQVGDSLQRTPSVQELIFHVDKTPITNLRSNIFGHQGVIIPLREGMIAKKCRIMQELQFYLNYSGWIHDILPSDLVPTVEGIATDLSEDGQKPGTVQVKMRRHGSLASIKATPYLILRDLANGFTKPAVLDIKLGTRTWAFGTEKEKVERMKGKCRDCPTAAMRFRIRAAMWYSKDPEKWPIQDNVNYVTREFGNTCTEEQLWEFLSDFFHFKSRMQFFTDKLQKLREAICRLRNEYKARMYSSSVLLLYDEADPSKMECRILDFAKTYLDIDQLAEKYHEKLDECEDDVVPAITNLLRMLRKIALITPCCSSNCIGSGGMCLTPTEPEPEDKE